MNLKKLLIGFVTMFALTLVVSVIVNFLWNFVFHGTATVDWETSFRLAIILGIIFGIALPWREERERTEKGE